MALASTADHMRKILADLINDLERAVRGNKAASQRVRTGSIKLEKAAKTYRKESVAAEKEIKGGLRAMVKRAKAAKTKASSIKKAASKKTTRKASRKKKGSAKRASKKKATHKKTAHKKAAPKRKAHKKAGTKRKATARRKTARSHARHGSTAHAAKWGRRWATAKRPSRRVYT